MTGFGMMIRSAQSLAVGACIGAAAMLAGCSSGSSGIATGSLLSGGPKQLDPASERVLQVAATSARAVKCGYNFDPGRLRTAYLAYESTQEGSGDKLARLEKSYDYTQTQVTAKMGPADEYCTDEQTAKIKSDLTRHLAGDFSPSVRKPEAGAFDWLQSSSSTAFDRQKALCPKNNCVPQQ